MKKPATPAESHHFSESIRFLAQQWNVETDVRIDLETGRADVWIWMPGTETVLALVGVDVRRVRVIERSRARFPEPPPRQP